MTNGRVEEGEAFFRQWRVYKTFLSKTQGVYSYKNKLNDTHMILKKYYL